MVSFFVFLGCIRCIRMVRVVVKAPWSVANCRHTHRVLVDEALDQFAHFETKTTIKLEKGVEIDGSE